MGKLLWMEPSAIWAPWRLLLNFELVVLLPLSLLASYARMLS